MIPEYTMPILVVDDYKTMTKIITNLLTQIGFTAVESVSGGTEALEKMEDGHIKLVISDWNMAPMTGLELLKRIRRNAKLAATPFIMVTAESKTENVIAAKKAGVNNYIVKPFNAAALKNKITSVFAPA